MSSEQPHNLKLAHSQGSEHGPDSPEPSDDYSSDQQSSLHLIEAGNRQPHHPYF